MVARKHGHAAVDSEPEIHVHDLVQVLEHEQPRGVGGFLRGVKVRIRWMDEMEEMEAKIM